MRLDQATFAFGFTIRNSAGNPNWGTSLGQGKEHKINSFADVEEILKGMVYSSVSLDRIELRIGKGGALRNGSEPSAGLVVGSVFNKVFVNDDHVEDCTLILVINKDLSPSHLGRLRLKYSPSNSFIRDDGTRVSNEDGLSKIRRKLGIASDACWFVHALTIRNQDELHLSVVVVNNAHPVEYRTTADLHAAWSALIGDPEDESSPKSETLSNQKDQIIFNVDRLTVALKLFAEKRAADKPSGWDSYDAWTHGVRNDFVAVDESLLVDPTFDYLGYIRKFAISWQVANTKFASHSADEQHAVLRFLKEHKDSPKPASWYIDASNRLAVGGTQVKGMSPKTVLYFMSELHPEEFAAWTEPTYDTLAFLGLHKGAAPTDLTIETYEDCKSKQQQIVARMKELGIGKATDDPSTPDYRTANEFLWWLGQDENKDLIKEKIMSKEFKKAEKTPKTGATRKLSEAVKDDDMMQRLMAALRTKPFAILAGHSGTGKSQLVRRLAYMTCNDEVLLKEKDDSNAPGNYCMVQVKPNWHDSTDLLGYYTEMNGGKYHTTPFVEFICKAYAYPETPFFVCLDEMNLAPVEQYFAEFLSAIESYSETTKLTDRLITEKASPEEICGETKLTESLEEVKKHGLTIPRNLFVVGTVNVDETTCQFSRKVLDRAMTILMTAVSFKSMTEPNDPSKEECLDPDGIKFFLERPTQMKLEQGQMDKLDAIQKQVGDSPFAIAYRFANEYALYQSAYQLLKGQGLKPDGKMPDPDNEDSQKTAIDHVVLMKLLPRIHGARPEMEVWFNGKDGDANKIGLVKTLGDGQSVDMMKSILARVGEYLSFWP